MQIKYDLMHGFAACVPPTAGAGPGHPKSCRGVPGFRRIGAVPACL